MIAFLVRQCPISTVATGRHPMLRVLAGLRSSLGIETAQVYVDHKLSYVLPTGRYYVDVTFTMPTGSHTVTVKAWDKNGAFSRSANINVQ